MLPLRGLSVCLSICLSVCHVHALCSNCRRYQHNFFAHDSHMPLLDHIKIWLTSVNPFFPKFCPKLTRPVMTWDNQQQIAVKWLEIAQWRAYRKPPLLFQMVPSLTPSPQNRILNAPTRTNCCPLANMIEDIDKISFAYKLCRLFGNLLWSLLLYAASYSFSVCDDVLIGLSYRWQRRPTTVSSLAVRS